MYLCGIFHQNRKEQMIRKFAALAMTAALFVACSGTTEDTMEKKADETLNTATEMIDKAADEANQAVEAAGNAVEAAGEAAEGAVDAATEGAQEVKEEVEKATGN